MRVESAGEGLGSTFTVSLPLAAVRVAEGAAGVRPQVLASAELVCPPQLIHRLHFAYTVTYHYLFPQLTMGLALLIVILKTRALWKRDERYDRAARFWAKIFAVNFLFGVITGIPMEFQFGTNWAKFSHYSGGVIATALTMEGVFAFFLESSFLGLFLYGEKRLGPKWHWFAAFMVFLGSWLSGYFIIVTDAWMQHPVGYELAADGTAHLTSFWALLANPWAFWQYVHNMSGAVVTASFVMAAVGAFYVLSRRQEEYGRLFLSSTAYITAMLGGAAFALYPVLLPSSTDPALSLTIHNAKTGQYSLSVGLIWWLVGTALAVGYFAFLYRFFRGRVSAEEHAGQY